MTTNRKIALILIIGIIIIALILILFFSAEKDRSGQGDVLKNETDPVEKIDPLTEVQAEIKLPPPTIKEKQDISMSALGKIFVEKFGTYSNHSEYINIEELLPFMTSSMAKWAQEIYIPSLKKEHDPDGYYFQIITKAPTAVIEKQGPEKIELRVSTQRTEGIDNTQAEPYVQDIILQLVKQGDNWLVDSAYWQEKE